MTNKSKEEEYRKFETKSTININKKSNEESEEEERMKIENMIDDELA